MSTDFERELDEIFGDAVSPQSLAEADLALDIAVQFAELRERRGLTQRELADLLEMSQQAVSKIENPTHLGHNLARLQRAVRALNATIDVTLVPLEDLATYRALFPPKPVLEELARRASSEREPEPLVQRGTDGALSPVSGPSDS